MQTTVITEKMIWRHKLSVVMQLRRCPFQKTCSIFWDDQSDGVKYYLSTLAPEHVNTVVSFAARPVVKKTVMDQRYGKNSLHAMTDGAVFECDRDKCSVIGCFSLGMKAENLS